MCKLHIARGSSVLKCTLRVYLLWMVRLSDQLVYNRVCAFRNNYADCTAISLRGDFSRWDFHHLETVMVIGLPLQISIEGFIQDWGSVAQRHGAMMGKTLLADVAQECLQPFDLDHCFGAGDKGEGVIGEVAFPYITLYAPLAVIGVNARQRSLARRVCVHPPRPRCSHALMSSPRLRQE